MQSCSVDLFQTGDLNYCHAYTLDFNDDIAQHSHPGWAFLLVKSGELTYSVEGKTFDVTPNSLVISRPGVVHMLQPKGPILYERHTLDAVVELLDKEILEQIPQDLHVLDVSKNQIIQNLYEKVLYYLPRLPEKQMEALLKSLINELIMNIYVSTQTDYQSPKHTTEHLIAKILDYIHKHIREPLTVSQISEAMSLSDGYLHLFFSKQMHMPIKKYIIMQKLQLVQKALHNNVHPTEACRQYGFRNYSTFYRNYQKVYGCSPSDGSKLPPHGFELKDS